MNHQPSGDPTKCWVYGINEPGWYFARWKWNEKDATRWLELGYRVERSIDKPTN